MSEWIFYSTIVGGIFTVIITQLLNRNWFAREQMKHKYNIKRFQLGKKYKLKEAELPSKTQKGILDQLKGIDRNTIGTILDALQGGEDEYSSDDISELLGSPIVQKILQGVNLGSKEKEELSDEHFSG